MQDQVTEKSKDKYSIEVKTPQQFSFQIAVVLTVLIIGFSVLIWLGVLHVPASPYEAHDSFADKAFNIADFGTYVSGVFTSLSFIWLVVNALQQREDLKLQREEMQENNEHQQKQADQLEATAKISLENSRIQKEIYANKQIIPQVRIIYYFIYFNTEFMKVHIFAESITKLSHLFEGISMYPPNFRIFQSQHQFNNIHTVEDNDAKIVFRTIDAIDRLNDYAKKIEENLSDSENLFSHKQGYEKFEILRTQFYVFENLLNWLEPNYAMSMRSMYKLDDIKNSFSILDKIPNQKMSN